MRKIEQYTTILILVNIYDDNIIKIFVLGQYKYYSSSTNEAWLGNLGN